MPPHAKEKISGCWKKSLIHAEKRDRYGAKCIYAELKEQRRHFRCKRIARLIGENRVEAKNKCNFKATTDLQHSFLVVPNLLRQNFIIYKPNRAQDVGINYCFILA